MVMKKLLLPAIACGLISSAPTVIFAEMPKPTRSAEGLVGQKDATFETRTRYIDEMEVMQKTQKGMRVGEEISEKRKMWTDELTQKGNELQQKDNDLKRRVAEYKNKMSTMSEDSRVAEEKKFARAEREISRMKQDYEERMRELDQDFKMAMEQATQDLFKEVEEVVRVMAIKENLDAVIGKTTGRVLYVSNKADYTEKIIVAMDEKYPESTMLAGTNSQMKPAMVS